ncbi:hypothetical protein LSH36_68g04044 [Paralvinella palmiformis]|uniref:PDZ domain-containing protein n=1 Tax=Paralvinella palmiformis TaxID=53620 RepID=A0AAD9NBP4_9ANNE|nr:hypothetical protein LSH36_68g04044 [Paralvinella palmiformis]
MSGLYPSLEDMEAGKMVQAQQQFVQAAQATAQATAHAIAYPASQGPPAYTETAPSQLVTANALAMLYPSLEEYMGLDLSANSVKANMPVVANTTPDSQVAQRYTSTGQHQLAPLSGNSVGIARSEIKQGVREIVLCKDQNGKMGLRLRSVNKGVFVAFVYENSPAALAGLRFGDQILQINGENVAGWSTDKAMKYLRNCPADRTTMAVRDRPFERSITLQKDSVGTVGFVFKENKITALVKDSSAARNGVLIDHHLVEVNGQNVVGLKEKEIKKIFDESPRTVTITIIPSFIYDHIVKSIGSSLIKKHMDHSIPDA